MTEHDQRPSNPLAQRVEEECEALQNQADCANDEALGEDSESLECLRRLGLYRALQAERDWERNRYHDMLMQKEGYKDLAADRAAEIERLRAALRAAKEKLELYRGQHSGEYIGGLEYMSLMRLIEEALK